MAMSVFNRITTADVYVHVRGPWRVELTLVVFLESVLVSSWRHDSVAKRYGKLATKLTEGWSYSFSYYYYYYYFFFFIFFFLAARSSQLADVSSQNPRPEDKSSSTKCGVQCYPTFVLWLAGE